MLMRSRRQFLHAAPAVAGLGVGLLATACQSGAAAEDYDALAATIWRPGTLPQATGSALQLELVRCATLAPSSHNTQCWKFALEDEAITVLPDTTRRCPAVDPDDHHLFVSLGCAVENLVQAALACGRQADAVFDPVRSAVRIRLTPRAPRTTALFQAIHQRQCARTDYDGLPLSPRELDTLVQAAATPEVQLRLITDPAGKARVLESVVQANTIQMADAAFVHELKSWIRFNGAEAARTRDGLYGAASGSPAVPTWLGRLAFGLFYRTAGENDKIVRQVRSSAGMAVFIGQAVGPASWVAVGRSYQRFALQATALGIRTAMLNQPVEVAALRQEFAASLGLAGQRPDLVVRFGRGPGLPRSLRRPVQAVLA